MSKSNTSSLKKKNDISINAILVSMENNIQLLLNEITIRGHKTLLNDIHNSITLISKKLEGTNPIADFNQDGHSNKNNKDISSSYNNDELHLMPEDKEEELNTLKEKSKDMKKAMLDHEEKINQLEKEKIQLQSDLEEQHNTNYQLTEDKKTLENCIKKLNEEFNKVSLEYETVLLSIKSKDKMTNDLKAQLAGSKRENENITSINNNLKERIVNMEKKYKLMTEELTISNKKNTILSKRIENAEAVNKQIKTEMTEKEEKHEILRQMNNKLESKSILILKRMKGYYVGIDKKVNHYVQQISDMDYSIKELNKSLLKQKTENEHLNKANKEMMNEKETMDNESKKLNERNAELQSINEELSAKKNELEQKLKVNLRVGEHISIYNNNSNSNNSKKAYSRADTNQSKINNAIA